MIKKIIKRDGTTQDFDKTKIKNAILKAFIATGEKDGSVAEKLADEVVKILEERIKGIPHVEDVQDIVEEVLIKHGYAKVAKAYILYRKEREKIREAKKFLGVHKDELKLTVNAIEVLRRRYLLRDEKGNIIETPLQMFKRVARAIASIEKERDKWENLFLRVMTNLEFLPNSPTLMNAGTDLGVLSACFVLPIEDSLESIFDTIKYTALIHKAGGGTGFNFSKIRPKGDVVKSTKGIACFSGDTRILTNKGFVKIKELVENKSLTSVATHRGYKPILNRYSGELEIFRVVLEDGYEVKVSEDHKFFVFDRNGNPYLKPLKELKVGDYVYLLIPDKYSTDYVELNTRIKSRSKAKLPNVLDEKLAYLLGILYADGHISYKYGYNRNGRKTVKCARIEIYLNNENEHDIKEKVRSISQEIFGVKVREYAYGNRTTLVIPSTKVVRFLEKNGLIKKESDRIYVPEHIFRSKPEVVSAFISGFFDGDGSFDNNYRIVFKSVSEQFIKDLQILLLALGIVSSIQIYKPKNRRKTVYSLRIQTKDMKIKAFRELKESVKISRIAEKALKYLEKRGKNKKYSFPFNVMYKIENEKVRAKLQRDLKILSYNSRVTHREFINKIIKLKDKLNLNSSEIEYFKLLSKLYPNKIVKIEKIGRKKVYDLEIRDVHLLSGNGVYTSNSGPVSFMRIFDVATDVIKQGGKRRGANMGILNYNHPDILEFITCKEREGVFENFNISVAVTDEFMEKAIKGEDYELINPRTNEAVGTINARDVFDLMVANAWRSGDPGIIFLDEINRHNPTPELGSIEATNPCGEVPLLPYESCNLGSINLSKFVKNNEIDFERLGEVVRIATRFLDNVIDVNRYPLKEIEEATKRTRKIGLGVMGFAEMLIKLEIPYDSDEALKTAERVMKFINETAKEVSRELALERGVFPAFEKSIYKGRYDALRNATVTTIAPTGTISIIAGTTSGIEPLFAVAYVREVLEGVRLVEVNRVFEEIAKKRGFYSKELITKIAKVGSVQNVDGVPRDVKRLFVTALDIEPEWHVRMQAAFQKYTDNAVAKTVNLPHNATLEDVRKVFLLAYKLRCKGITVYRYGSKSKQVLYVGEHVKVSSEYSGGCARGEICEL